MTDNSPRQRRRDKNTNAILDIATSLIIAKGLANVSLRDIAKAADYSPAALYKYFDSKEAMIRAVQLRENQQLIALLETVPGDIPAMLRLIKLSLLYIQYCLKNGAYLTLMNSLPSGRKSKSQPIPPTSPYTLFLNAVKAWIEDEAIPVDQDYGLEEITYALWSLIHGMATLRLSQLKDFQADFEAVNQRTIELFLNGLR